MSESGGWRGVGRPLAGALLLLLVAVPAQAQEQIDVPGVVYRPAARQADDGPLRAPRHPAPALEAGALLVLGAMPPLEQQPENARIGQPLRVGVPRLVENPAIAGSDLEWRDAVGGGSVALVGVRSSGAEGLRIAVRARSVPEGAEFRFYSPDAPGAPEVFGQVELGASRAASRSDEDPGPFWSPAVGGETMVLEVWLPAGTSPDRLRLNVEQVTHLYREVFGPTPSRSGDPGKDLASIGSSGSCNRDIACDPRWQTTADSVAKYIFAEDGYAFLCTGQLVADMQESLTPYFLTAAHCVSTRRVARSMTFFWFFQRAACAGADPTEVIQTNSGARLLLTTGSVGEGTDHTLVRLKRRQELPEGVVFSGWSSREAERLERKRVEGIHHPSGDVKMGSVGKGQRLVGINESGQIVDDEPRSHYEIVWRKGTTEGGSSGSGIWFGRRWPNQYLMGVLTGGFASCQRPGDPDYYGRFDLTFAQEPRLRKFLTGSRK